MNRLHVFFVVLLMISTVGHGSEAGILPIRIESSSHVHAIRAELAVTDEQRARGLMARDTLAEEAGMLFLYNRPQPGHRGFWMYGTRIPLDIAFVDANGRIVSMFTMQPCTEALAIRCPAYLPDEAYLAALEVNGGYFAKRGIRIGDRVVWPGMPRAEGYR